MQKKERKETCRTNKVTPYTDSVYVYFFFIIIILFYTTVQCLDSNLKVVNKKKKPCKNLA